jgi:hypothetical protein
MYCNLASADRALPDVGANIEVRSSPNLKARMPIRKKERSGRCQILFCGWYISRFADNRLEMGKGLQTGLLLGR